MRMMRFTYLSVIVAVQVLVQAVVQEAVWLLALMDANNTVMQLVVIVAVVGV